MDQLVGRDLLVAPLLLRNIFNIIMIRVLFFVLLIKQAIATQSVVSLSPPPLFIIIKNNASINKLYIHKLNKSNNLYDLDRDISMKLSYHKIQDANEKRYGLAKKIIQQIDIREAARINAIERALKNNSK